MAQSRTVHPNTTEATQWAHSTDMKKAPLPEPNQSCGGDEGDRTLDLLDATEALSQLSYVPRTSEHFSNHARGVNGKMAKNFSSQREHDARTAARRTAHVGAIQENRPPLHENEPTSARWVPSSLGSSFLNNEGFLYCARLLGLPK